MQKDERVNVRLNATWRKLVGIAFLWAGLAGLISVPSLGDAGLKSFLVPTFGFLSFAFGVAMLMDALKIEIVGQLQRENKTA